MTPAPNFERRFLGYALFAFFVANHMAELRMGSL